MFTRAGGFDGGVEGEQVGLLADLLNDVDDFADFLGAMGEGGHFFGDGAGGRGDFLHGVGGGLHDGSALVGSFGGDAAGCSRLIRRCG